MVYYGKYFQTKVLTSGQCKGGKKSKYRITVAFTINAAGKSEVKLFAIWKSDNPHCFQGVKKDLPVEFYSQPKAWMTSKVNWKVRMKGRSVLYTAGCHLFVYCWVFLYSKIKVVFLPANVCFPTA